VDRETPTHKLAIDGNEHQIAARDHGSAREDEIVTDHRPGRPRGDDAPPLLSELDPDTVARDVCELVRDHIAQATLRLDMHATVTLPAHAGALGLGAIVRALTLYAQHGLPVWDWEDHGCASDACLEVFAALYSCAGSPEIGGGITDLADDIEPTDAIGVVLLAALVRIRISQQSAVAPRELAVLAGVTDQQVRHLIRAGEIATTRYRGIPSEEARRWLTARGVRGSKI
jgi:hypothetical protein